MQWKGDIILIPTIGYMVLRWMEGVRTQQLFIGKVNKL